MAQVFGYKRAWLALLALPALLLPYLASKNPAATERIYARGVYPRLAAAIGRVSGALPFSLAEILLVSFVLWLIIYIIISVKGRSFAALAATLLCLGGVIWFGFVGLCGLNYHREAFTRHSGLAVRPSSAAELSALCAELCGAANEYAALVSRDEAGVMRLGFKNSYEAARFAPGAFSNIAEKYPLLGGYYTRPKPVTASVGLSLVDLVGVYFPFTFEANVNRDAVDYVIPSSMLHELVHFKGYMREEEANYIAYAACVSCGNADFAYSGIMLALRHSLNALYSADRDAYFAAAGTLSEAVNADYAANDAYWRRFESPLFEVSTAVNDVYLRTNSQPSGVKSYGQMVDLLLAERRARLGLE